MKIMYKYMKTKFLTNNISFKINAENYLFNYLIIFNLKCFFIETIFMRSLNIFSVIVI